MAMAFYRDGRAFALGVVGAAALLATMAGEYLMHNPAQAQDFRNCPDLSCLNKTGTLVLLPYPATAVVLPDGSTPNITLYQVMVLALGALIFASALACAMRTTLVRRSVLAAAAVLLALTLMFFRAQAPVDLVVGNPSVVPHPFVIPYQPNPALVPGTPPFIDSFWFMAPAAALGLLTTGIALVPAGRRVTRLSPD
jgi:hypothetical protein